MKGLPKTRFVIAILLIVGSVAYLMFSGVKNSMVYYYGLSELHAKSTELAGSGVRLTGLVSAGTIERDNLSSTVNFSLYEKSSGKSMPIRYQGVIPDTFKDDAEVVVEGVYRPEESYFLATTLLAKCPSKYEAQGEEHPEEISLQNRVPSQQ
ncbi:MAG: cytochrome c maturation protein CcmE [Acidobacteria bacterium]|nr:cytochrome c maturation protein CcmE [Acidobacteriota bacterium]